MKRNYSANSATITQVLYINLIVLTKSKEETIYLELSHFKKERFTLLKNDYNGSHGFSTWFIPITFTKNFSDENYRKEWLKSSEAQLDDLPQPSQWVIFNVNLQGFYRVNYDLQNWDLIVSQLLDDHKKIDVVNRAALLDDAFSLARASVLDYSIPLKLAIYLSKEREYLPWKTTLNSLSYLNNMLKMTPVYEMFQVQNFIL